MKITLGFSPCPNDTFIFDALIHKKIDTGGFEFIPVLADVEELNRQASETSSDVTKLSFFAYSKVAANYQLLDSGSALGKNCGPLLVSKSQIPVVSEAGLSNLRIAIPGENTTANFLLTHFFSEAKNKYAVVFSEIENEVLSGKADAGLIIHESRFTYKQKGLKKILDFGELWESETKLPLPLGGIAVNRNLSDESKKKINLLIRQSIEFAFKHPDSSRYYVKQHSQAMEDEVIEKHIRLYVNEYSVTLGEDGRNAVRIFLEKINPALFSVHRIFLD